MGTLPDIRFNVTAGNLGRIEPDADNVAALIVCVASNNNSSFADGSINKLFSISQVENELLLTPDYDINEGVLLYHHIAEFFLENPNGELWVLTKIATSAITIDDIFNASTGHALAFVRGAAGRIKQMGVVLNQPSLHTSFMDDILTHTANVQSFAELMASEYKILDAIFIEGLGFNAATGSVIDVRAVGQRNVSVVLGQDAPIVALHANFVGTACIGTALGRSTDKQIHECFAQPIEKNLLTDVAKGRFLDVIIKKTAPDPYKNNPISEEVLNAAGYIFPRQYPNVSGFYFNQSNNSVPLSDDYYCIELVQVINKAQRLIYTTLLKYINKHYPITSSGRLQVLGKKEIENDVRTTLDVNMSNNYSELATLIIDPDKDGNNQPYPSIQTDNTLRAIVGIRAMGKLIHFVVSIGYTP